MTKLSEIVDYLDSEFETKTFPDNSLNGMQFEGSEEVKKIAVAVDAGLSVVEDAVKRQANLLIVHHGILWQKTFAIVGAARKLYKTILENNLSIITLHLPLDAHQTYGNNYVLANLLELEELIPCAPIEKHNIGCKGLNRKNLTLKELEDRLNTLPGAAKNQLTLSFGPKVPRSVCVISGAGADVLYRYLEDDFDTLISGEARQFAYHYCQERRINAIFAGHYATETLGVKEVGKSLADKFSLSWEFIDQPTGI